MSKRRCYCYGLTGLYESLMICHSLFHFLGCKDKSRGRATCIKLVKEMGIQVCYTDVAPLKAKLERSCGETCKFCKHHKWYSHKSLNARPNRPFHRFFFFLFIFIKTTERISIDSGGKSALKLVNLKNSEVILSEKILPHKVAKSLLTFVWLRARNCHHTTSVRCRVTCTVFLLRSDRSIEIKLSNFSLGGGRPKDCRTSIYGCCWDAYTPRGDVYGIKGCPGKVLIQRE